MNNIVSQTLQALKQIQELDCQIFGLEKIRQEKPSLLNSKKEKAAKIKSKIEHHKEEIKKIKLEMSKKELDLKTFEEKMQKMEQQLNTVKTNKEYSTLQNEINGVKADRSLIEDKMLELMGQIETFQKKTGEYESQIAEVEKEISALNDEINTEITKINHQLDEIGQCRQKSCSEMEKETINNYERIIRNKADRVALAKVMKYDKDSSRVCQGCHMDVTPQQVNELLKGKQLVYCRSCMRILYIEPEEQKS